MSEIIDVVASYVKSGGWLGHGGRTCPKCGGKRSHNKFPKRGWFCNTCNNDKRRKWYAKEKGFKLVMLLSAKKRAELKGLPFDLKLEDFVIPEFCPVLGIPLKPGTRKNHWNAPTLDRIVLEKGYVKDNVVVISWRANFIRSNASLDELQKVLAYSEKITKLQVCSDTTSGRRRNGTTVPPDFERNRGSLATAQPELDETGIPHPSHHLN